MRTSYKFVQFKKFIQLQRSEFSIGKIFNHDYSLKIILFLFRSGDGSTLQLLLERVQYGEYGVHTECWCSHEYGVQSMKNNVRYRSIEKV